ncbi:MAG: TIGR01906 family membrane protein [Anaerolineae bacterium]|nr:TIGR01906 family membrane protein [Anaerolineae bacterium]
MSISSSRSRSRLWRSLVVAVIIVLVPVLLVLGSIRLLLTETYLNLEYNKPDFPADTYGFTLQDRLYFAPYAVQYLLNGAEVSYIGDLKFSDGSPLYNDRELEHMVDVKKVIQGAMWALLGAALVFTLLSVWLFRSPEGRLVWRNGLIGGATTLLIAFVGLIIYLLLDWDNFFDSFHNLFFAQGTWTFSYSDTLIRLFPIRFWQDAAITVGLVSAISAILILIAAWRWRVK